MRMAFRYALAIVLLFCAMSRAERPDDFGRRWVRSHPFTTMGLSILPKTFRLDQYRNVNYTFLLAWKPRAPILSSAADAGYPWFLHLYGKEGPTSRFQERVRGLLAEYVGNVGLLINDEPTLHGANNFERTGAVLAWLRHTWPDRLHLSNIGPPGGSVHHYYGRIAEPTAQQEEEMGNYSYEQYVRDYVRIVRPDVLMFDAYIFNHGEGSESGVTDLWYRSLAVIRRAALAARLPYWCFVQAWERPINSPGYNVRLPSESDYRMQVFSALTYGFTGIADFMYCPAHQRDILMPGGLPSPLYEPAARAHAEVLRLGRTLRFLTSTHVEHMPSTDGGRPPAGLAVWAPGAASDPLIRSIRILDDGPHRRGLIGHFRDDAGQTCFMVTNLRQHAHRTAAECAVRVRMVFDPTVKAILRLSRETGEVERLAINDTAQGLTVTIPGGTGDLFKYDTGPFAGFESCSAGPAR